MLKIPNSEWCMDHDTLHEHAGLHFKELFIYDSNHMDVYNICVVFLPIAHDVRESMDSLPSPMEVKDALFSMAPLKSMCINGLHVQFFQKHWDSIGPSICSM
ncbi:hypothetical protein V6N12_024527 [Hibiscus sabdariffa]|uniref:Uncharacterized protein n=1 Tax=Hibiscus sabdariffa TaxID=183260 RepID=A0ABR2G1I6_9ROSI